MQENEKDLNKAPIEEEALQNDATSSDENAPKIDVVKGIEMLESQLIETQQTLENVQKELDINNETFKRTLAEYDNYRKRTTKEKADNYTNGVSNAVTTLLPVLDTLEMALAAPCTDEGYKKGIEMTLTVAKDALGKIGVEEIDALNQEFDPNFHAAVMQEQVEGTDPNKVVKQLQKGYKMADKVIRPATVIVSC